MSTQKVRIKVVHPFIRYEREIELEKVQRSLNELMRVVLEETKACGRYSQRGRQRYDRLKGCIVMQNGCQTGYFDESGFRMVQDASDELNPDEEILVMIPITGG